MSRADIFLFWFIFFSILHLCLQADNIVSKFKSKFWAIYNLFYLCILNTRRSFHLRLTINSILTMWAQIYFKPYFVHILLKFHNFDPFCFFSLFLQHNVTKMTVTESNSYKSTQVPQLSHNNTIFFIFQCMYICTPSHMSLLINFLDWFLDFNFL